jgi:hypothetical protein
MLAGNGPRGVRPDDDPGDDEAQYGSEAKILEEDDDASCRRPELEN